MTEHVDEDRLASLAKLQGILDQPEWAHLRGCPDCMYVFAERVKAERAATLPMRPVTSVAHSSAHAATHG